VFEAIQVMPRAKRSKGTKRTRDETDLISATTCLVDEGKEEEVKAQKVVDEAYLCGVCLEVLNEPVTLTCQHNFCKICLHKALKTNCLCPSCREAVPGKIRDNLRVNLLLQESILKLVPSVAEKREQARQAKLRTINEKKSELEQLDKEVVDTSVELLAGNVRIAVAKAKAAVVGLELLILEEKVTEKKINFTRRKDQVYIGQTTQTTGDSWMPHGLGKVTTRSGDIYEGQWHEGKIHGHGKSYTDDQVTLGEFQADEQHGYCKRTTKDGTVIEGLFEDKHGLFLQISIQTFSDLKMVNSEYLRTSRTEVEQTDTVVNVTHK